MRFPQPVYNNLLVRVEKNRVDTINSEKLSLILAGTEGSEDTSRGAQTVGYVASVPRVMFNGNTIVPELKVGDKIFMHYSSIDDASLVELPDGDYYLVPYDYVFAVLKYGKVEKMIGARVFCLPVTDEDDVVSEDGMLVKKTSSGIIYEINVEHNTKVARIAHIGTPLDGAPVLPVKAGDLVIYDKDADFENDVEGTTYFSMVQEDLLMYQPK